MRLCRCARVWFLFKRISRPQHGSVICEDFPPLGWISSKPFCSSSVSNAVRLPVSHMDSFFSSWRTSHETDAHVTAHTLCVLHSSSLQTAAHHLMWLWAVKAPRMLSKWLQNRCLCCLPCYPHRQSSLIFSEFALPREFSLITLVQLSGLVLCCVVVSQLRDWGRPAGTCIHLAWCGMLVPNGSRGGNGNTSLQPLPFKSLINTWQLNIAPQGIDNRKPKADYFRVKSLEGLHPPPQPPTYLPLTSSLNLQCRPLQQRIRRWLLEYEQSLE